MTTNNWTPDQPIVSVKDVHKSFGKLEVLKGINHGEEEVSQRLKHRSTGFPEELA